MFGADVPSQTKETDTRNALIEEANRQLFADRNFTAPLLVASDLAVPEVSNTVYIGAAHLMLTDSRRHHLSSIDDAVVSNGVGRSMVSALSASQLLPQSVCDIPAGNDNAMSAVIAPFTATATGWRVLAHRALQALPLVLSLSETHSLCKMRPGAYYFTMLG